MTDTTEAHNDVPWTSFGRDTPISRLSKSVLAVGNCHTHLPISDLKMVAVVGDPATDPYVMRIEGTAFKVGRGKYLTCWHVCQVLNLKSGRACILKVGQKDGKWQRSYWFIQGQLSFIDMRHKQGNKDIDVGVLICPAEDTDMFSFDVPNVQWGDSTQLGVGDQVLIGGYPLGEEMFYTTSTNRGLIQPTFYRGMISAIIPATNDRETRLLQIDQATMGGISGGVVCDPITGAVLGMVTSGLTDPTSKREFPITYAIPSEILRPYADGISFKVKNSDTWK